MFTNYYDYKIEKYSKLRFLQLATNLFLEKKGCRKDAERMLHALQLAKFVVSCDRK